MALAISDATAASLYGPPEVTESEDLLRHRRRESEGMTLKLQAGLETRRKRRPVEKKGDCGGGARRGCELRWSCQSWDPEDEDESRLRAQQVWARGWSFAATPSSEQMMMMMMLITASRDQRRWRRSGEQSTSVLRINSCSNRHWTRASSKSTGLSSLPLGKLSGRIVRLKLLVWSNYSHRAPPALVRLSTVTSFTWLASELSL